MFDSFHFFILLQPKYYTILRISASASFYTHTWTFFAEVDFYLVASVTTKCHYARGQDPNI